VRDEEHVRYNLDRMVETKYDSLIVHLREAARPEREQPPAARAYLETVRRHAYRVTDDQVGELRAGGVGEDEIFELTVAAAVAAGLERLDAGLRTLA
jgi:alkylhydroperoxidase family enzyme